ncbi:MAG: phosphoribosylglycinamide formyltransferase [Faecalibacterium sp.]|nr:phosphoribosylglycinamide formyltransferase [Ruminococcus sp.]MCM1391670.1 phosphoribosylglycinamide formyltransferase [Ruminococcus sp.]MCM1485987.1 phosphoribosylglycinamide formyltransferase [Faecalibacterium sp.]
MNRDKTKIAVLVSGGGTNLQAILNACDSGIISHGEVKVVISSRSDAYALTRAKNHNVPGFVVSRKESGTQENFENGIIKILEDNNIELIVLAGFMSILSESFTKKYAERILNVHPSLIPSFCGKGFYGLRVHEAALEYGVTVTGATVHFVNEIPDGGRIILQRAVYIEPDDTPETLQKRVMEQAEWDILPKATEIVSKEIYDNK